MSMYTKNNDSIPCDGLQFCNMCMIVHVHDCACTCTVAKINYLSRNCEAHFG